MQIWWRLALALMVILTAAGSVDATSTQNAPRIGWLTDGATPAAQSDLQGVFVDALTALGYVDGQTVVLERLDAARQTQSLGARAAELVGRNVRVIVATSGAAALAARRATSSIPIVMVESGDPVATGIVASLAHPGGNVTGLSGADPTLTARRLRLLKEIAPTISRVAVLYQPSFPATVMAVNDARSAATRLGLTVVPVEVPGPDALSSAFTEALRLVVARARSDA